MPSSLIALDVGDRRIGIALASEMAQLPKPWGAIDRQVEDTWSALEKLINENQVQIVVIGLPRGLEGQETAQTAIVRDFAKQFAEHFSQTINFQDEAVTSKMAEAELQDRQVSYNKADIDALAATYILTDYLADHKGE